jgi:DNA-binding IclR family transcriptional regulator
MAFFSDDKLGKYLLNNEFQKYTPKTIINTDYFREHLRQVAQDGYAIELEELDLGVACIGASIRDFNSNVVGAVTCVGPTHRFTDNRMRNVLIPLVTKGAADISIQLGCQ